MQQNSFAKELTNWYKKSARKLPWREEYEPYKTWLSEIMLQQTQVNTVIDYFNRFIAAYPDIYTLCQAKEEDIFKLWEGLGYYSRAKKILECAKTIVEEYNGVFPKDLNQLKKLPGIGPYTAGAILSIAYNLPAPAVDGNVMRVLSRYQMLDLNIADTKNRSFFEKEVLTLMTDAIPRDFNQALMDLGATICTPKQAKCSACPVKEGCKAFYHNKVEKYPVKLKKNKKRLQKVSVILVKDQDKILIVKRPDSGLMANLWGFPVVEDIHGNAHENIEKFMKDTFGLEVFVQKTEEGPKHVFTHLVWEMQLFKCILQSTRQSTPKVLSEIQWVKTEQLKEYAFPTAFKKIIMNEFDLKSLDL